MKTNALKSVQILSRSGIIFLLLFFSSVVVHFLVLSLDLYLIDLPLFFNLEKDFLGTALSFPMIPFIGAYLLFCSVAYYYWAKMKNEIIKAQEKELQVAKDKVMIESTQKLVSIFAQHITTYNTEILQWIEDSRSNNKSIPQAVEVASRNIAAALGSLTEAVFLTPYSTGVKDNNSINLDDVDFKLRKDLARIK